MNPCIVVKGIQFVHQLLYTGNGDEAKCHFCQQFVSSRAEHDKQQAEIKSWAESRWPEGAEI